MFPKRFMERRQVVEDHPFAGISDAVFMSSRGGQHFRRFMDAFLRPGLDQLNWTDRNCYIGPNVVPTGPDEMSLYYMEHYRRPTCRLRRATLRTDGFVSVNAPYEGGELLTRPLAFTGHELVLNFATSAAGSLNVEIQDAEGHALEGYGLKDSREFYGDHVEHAVRWGFGTKATADIGALADRPVRLRFVLKDADLYSLRFR
jgi:hypothetical protein